MSVSVSVLGRARDREQVRERGRRPFGSVDIPQYASGAVQVPKDLHSKGILGRTWLVVARVVLDGQRSALDAHLLHARV